MSNNNIYVLRVNGRARYFALRPLISDVSGEEIENYGLMIRCFSRLSFENKCFVVSESEAVKIKRNDLSIPPEYSTRLYDYTEVSIVNIVSVIPKGSFLFTNPTPGLSPHKGSSNCFDAATTNFCGEAVVDRTVYADKKLCENIDFDRVKELLAERDEELALEFTDPTPFLTAMQYLGRKQIAYEQQRLLEGGFDEED